MKLAFPLSHSKWISVTWFQLSELLLINSAALGGRDQRPVQVTSWQGAFFSLSAVWILFWSVQENPKLKRVPPLLQFRWQGILPWLTEAPSVIKFPCVWVTGNYNHCFLRLQNTMRFLSYKQTSIILERQTDLQTDTIWENKYSFVCTAGGNFPLGRKSLLWWMNIVCTLEEELLCVS